MLGSLDPAKILVILVIALIVLGPERLPRAARQLGAAWRELTRVREQVTEEVRSAIPDVGLPDVPRIRPGAVSGFLSDLTRSDAREGSSAAGAGHRRGGGPGGRGSRRWRRLGTRGGDRGGAAGGAGVPTAPEPVGSAPGASRWPPTGCSVTSRSRSTTRA